MSKYLIGFYSDVERIIEAETEEEAWGILREIFDGYEHDFKVILIEESEKEDDHED